jgi:hypothetical protein
VAYSLKLGAMRTAYRTYFRARMWARSAAMV